MRLRDADAGAQALHPLVRDPLAVCHPASVTRVARHYADRWEGPARDHLRYGSDGCGPTPAARPVVIRGRGARDRRGLGGGERPRTLAGRGRRGRTGGDPEGAAARRVRGRGTPASRRAGSRSRPGRCRTAASISRPAQARVAEAVLAPYNLGRLNPLGLNSAAPALFAHGTEEQRLRFLPPTRAQRGEVVPAAERAGRGLGPRVAGHPGRARRRGVGAQRAEGLDDVGAPLRLRDLSRPHRSERPEATRAHLLRRRPARAGSGGAGRCATSAARSTSTRCSSTTCASPTSTGSGRRATAGAWPASTLAGERQMVSGSGSGGVDRIGGSGVDRIIQRAVELGRTGRRGRPPTAHAAVQRGTDPGLDEPTRARVGAGGRHPGSRRLDRQGAPGRPEPAAPTARRRPARAGRDGVGRTEP